MFVVLYFEGNANGQKTEVELQEFIKTDMNKKIIISVFLPALENSKYYTRTFKVFLQTNFLF